MRDLDSGTRAPVGPSMVALVSWPVRRPPSGSPGESDTKGPTSKNVLRYEVLEANEKARRLSEE